MEGIELAKAYVQIVPSAEGISNGIKQALGAEMESAGNSSGKTFASSFKDLAVAGIAASAAALTTAIGTTWQQATRVAAIGDEIDKTSQKLGVTASEYQAMSYAAEHAGFSVSAFTAASKALARTDFSGSIWDAVNAITAIEDPAERAATAEELLGANAVSQMAALINGGQTLDEYRDSLESLGGVLSDDAVASSAAFEDAMTDLSASFTGLRNNMVSAFLPSMTEVINGFVKLITGDAGGLEMIKSGIGTFFNDLSAMLPQVIDVASGLIEAFIDVIIDNLPQIIESGVKLVVSLISGIIKALPRLAANVPQIIKVAFDVLVDGAKEFVKIGAAIVDGVWQGIKNAAASFTANVKNFFSNIVDTVKGALGIHSPSKVFADSIGQYIPAGIAQGINQNADLVTNALDDITTDAVASVDLSANGSGFMSSIDRGSDNDALERATAQIVAAIRQIPPASLTIGDRDIVQSYRRGVQLMGSTSIGGIA